MAHDSSDRDFDRDFDAEFHPATARDRYRQLGWEEPDAHTGNAALTAILAKHFPLLVGAGDAVAVPDHPEEMNWRLFFAHSQDMQGFRADIFTGGPCEAKNPFDPAFRGLRERWETDHGGDSRTLIEGLAALWEDAEARKALTRMANPFRSKEEKADGVAPALDLLTGPRGNAATRVFAQTLRDLKGPKIARSTNRMIRAYVQNSALLKQQHGSSFRQYLQAIAPDIFLPAVNLVEAERAWRSAIVRDFFNVGDALAAYLIADWLLGLWQAGQIEWFESYKEDSVFLKALAERDIVPAAAAATPEAFIAYCQTLRAPAAWIPASRFWLAAYPLPPRLVNEAIWLEFNGSSGNPDSSEPAPKPAAPVAPVAPITDTADWPKRTWDLPPYKSPAFLAWLEETGSDLETFRRSPAYRWAVARELIADDEWVDAAAALPETLASPAADGDTRAAVERRIRRWVAWSGRDVFPVDALLRLEAILSEAQFDPQADPEEIDPLVYVPLLGKPTEDEAGGQDFSYRTMATDQGDSILGAFTSRERLAHALGEENPWRMKSPLSNLCRLFLTVLRETDVAIRAIVLNPGEPGAVALPLPLVEALAGIGIGRAGGEEEEKEEHTAAAADAEEADMALEKGQIDAEDILMMDPPSRKMAATDWARLRSAARTAMIYEGLGAADAYGMMVTFRDLSMALWIGLPTTDEPAIGRIWSILDLFSQNLVSDLPFLKEIPILPIPPDGSGLAQLFAEQGEPI